MMLFNVLKLATDWRGISDVEIKENALCITHSSYSRSVHEHLQCRGASR